MFDTGVTVQEFNHLLRNRAVQVAAGRVSRESGRCSKSRVAIMTGLPRSEVTRILGLIHSESEISYRQHPARRVLAAWYDNPSFLTDSGEPAVLPIFGKRRSFEHLVAMHGAGIPVRAMLDELTQINAVERLADQKVTAISRVPISTGLTPNALAAVGERCGDCYVRSPKTYGGTCPLYLRLLLWHPMRIQRWCRFFGESSRSKEPALLTEHTPY